MGKKLPVWPMPNAQCPKQRGEQLRSPTSEWSFPSLSINIGWVVACFPVGVR
ncbi:MAG: hypothetical protein V7L20_04535 [Nostoc sp.]|uniref:hypothetical protein n=1 Tax=Nostoc sp. TaxID=1180 RepID=UPI002FFD16B9